MEWFFFVAMGVRAFVFHLPLLDNFDAAEALGRSVNIDVIDSIGVHSPVRLRTTE